MRCNCYIHSHWEDRPQPTKYGFISKCRVNNFCRLFPAQYQLVLASVRRRWFWSGGAGKMTAARKLVEPPLNNLFTLLSADSYLNCHFLYVSFVVEKAPLSWAKKKHTARHAEQWVTLPVFRLLVGHLPLRMHLSRGEGKKILLMAVGETCCLFCNATDRFDFYDRMTLT